MSSSQQLALAALLAQAESPEHAAAIAQRIKANPAGFASTVRRARGWHHAVLRFPHRRVIVSITPWKQCTGAHQPGARQPRARRTTTHTCSGTRGSPSREPDPPLAARPGGGASVPEYGVLGSAGYGVLGSADYGVLGSANYGVLGGDWDD
jgi:hypothetical protein